MAYYGNRHFAPRTLTFSAKLRRFLGSVDYESIVTWTLVILFSFVLLAIVIEVETGLPARVAVEHWLKAL